MVRRHRPPFGYAQGQPFAGVTHNNQLVQDHTLHRGFEDTVGYKQALKCLLQTSNKVLTTNKQ